MKDLRSLSLPNMKPSPSQSQYILTPGSERVEHGSLGRKESIDLLVSLNPARQDSSHYSGGAELLTAGRRPVTGALFFLPGHTFVFHCSFISRDALGALGAVCLRNPFVTSAVPHYLPSGRRQCIFGFSTSASSCQLCVCLARLPALLRLLIPPDRLQG